MTWTQGDLSFNGIAIGTFACIAAYHVMNYIAKVGPSKGELYVPPTTGSGDEELTRAH